jgi:hypothetical protein
MIPEIDWRRCALNGRNLPSAFGENNSNWVVFPSETFCRSFQSQAFSQQLQTSEQKGGRRCPKILLKILIFCLQFLGRLFTLEKNCRACAKKNLSGALNQNKKT